MSDQLEESGWEREKRSDRIMVAFAISLAGIILGTILALSQIGFFHPNPETCRKLPCPEKMSPVIYREGCVCAEVMK